VEEGTGDSGEGVLKKLKEEGEDEGVVAVVVGEEVL